MVWASVFWKIALGVLLLTLSAALGYIWATVSSIRETVHATHDFLRTRIDRMFDRQAVAEIQNQIERLKENANRLGDTMANIG